MFLAFLLPGGRSSGLRLPREAVQQSLARGTWPRLSLPEDGHPCYESLYLRRCYFGIGETALEYYICVRHRSGALRCCSPNLQPERVEVGRVDMVARTAGHGGEVPACWWGSNDSFPQDAAKNPESMGTWIWCFCREYRDGHMGTLFLQHAAQSLLHLSCSNIRLDTGCSDVVRPSLIRQR